MNTLWDSATEFRYQKKTREESEKAYRHLLRIIIPFFSCFAVLDWTVMPKDSRILLTIVRIAGLSVLSATYFLSKKKPIAWTPQIFILSLTLSVTLFGIIAGDYNSSFFYALSLLIFIIPNLFPWGPKKTAAWVFSLGWFYLTALAIHTHFIIHDPSAFANNVAFINGSAFIAVWGAWNADRLRRELFTQFQAVDTRDEFISIASHELKTPITAMKIQAWLLNKNLKQYDFGPHRNLLQTFNERNEIQIKRLTVLVEDMLDLSRITSGNLRFEVAPMNLNLTLRELVERLMPQLIASGIQVKFSEENPVIGNWDRTRIDQVFTNLVINAIKYAAHAPLEIRIKNTPEAAVVDVQDHGPGIAKAFREKIFERFERGTATLSVGGLGLGLYISKQIVLGHGGDLHLVDTEEQGSCFRITLPLRS